MPILYPEPEIEDSSMVARGSSSSIVLLVALGGLLEVSGAWVLEGVAERSALQDALDEHLKGRGDVGGEP